MAEVYIALVDTPGFFASIIKKVIGIEYCHVVLSLDETFDQAYSVNRRNPAIPFFAGFVKEDSVKILRKFPTASYRIIRLPCSMEQKKAIQRELEFCYKRRWTIHYCVIGLPFLIAKRPFYQKNHYTCSSFLAKLFDEQGISLFDKHSSLVTPRDFYELTGFEKIYEGSFSSYLSDQVQWKEAKRHAW